MTPIDRLKSWLVGISFALVFIVFYFQSSYQSLISDRRVAYVYDPTSKEIYLVEMAPFVAQHNQWDPFIPFRKLIYRVPDRVEYLGHFDEVLADHQESMELLETDLNLWKEKLDKEHKVLAEDSSYIMTHWSLEYYFRDEPLIDSNIPEHVLQLRTESKQYRATELQDISTVDIVVAKHVYDLGNNKKYPTEIRVLKNVLLIEGLTASLMARDGFFW